MKNLDANVPADIILPSGFVTEDDDAGILEDILDLEGEDGPPAEDGAEAPS